VPRLAFCSVSADFSDLYSLCKKQISEQISLASIKDKYDVAVVGGGLVGLSTARRIALIAPKDPKSDGRTTAMLKPTIDYLDELGIWESCQGLAAPMRTMRLVDGTKRLIRAPLTEFKAAELSLEAFGFNVPNAAVCSHLETLIANSPSISRIETSVESADTLEDKVCLRLKNMIEITADIVAACDGRNSFMRESAGIETNNWSYPQTAIVLNSSHSLPHNDVSTEFHTETGPFTQVPLPPTKGQKLRSSLVWVVNPNQVDGLLTKSNEELADLIETKMQSYLGKLELEASPQCFPLSGMTAKVFAQNRVFLLGEAAHVFPPIGAQGFNLGLRDVAAFVKTVNNHSESKSSDELAEIYHRSRAPDISASTGAVDLLNRSLLADFLPVQAVRAVGLSVIGQVGWLRKLTAKRGLAPLG